MAKKLTKEELEQDPLLQSYQKLQEIYFENKNLILGSAIAVILAIGSSIGYYYYSSVQEEKAQQLMSNAQLYYMNGEYEKALTGSEEEFTVGFGQIIRNYEGTDAANLAYYYSAVSEYNLGNTEKALDYMNKYEVPGGILGVGPLSFKAALQTDLGMYEQAARTYVQAADWNINNSSTPYNYLKAAHMFESAGDDEQAQKYARKVVEEYPNSSQVTGAQRLLGKLMAKKR